VNDILAYQSVQELKKLSIEQLQALWDLVPTERQRAYKAAYDREVRTAGAIGSDTRERRVAAELLNRYRDTALVPVGQRWARTPTRVQDAARSNALTESPDADTPVKSGKPSPKLLAALFIGGLIFGAILLLRPSGNRATTVSADVTPIPSLTAEVSPTPTPLALEAQDDVIQAGDTARAVAYPVSLQIIPPDGDPRVWVVQRRAVRAAEWNYDPNPDTASFVNGMSVRPVIGLPWSEDNAVFFDQIADGSEFLLSMNTGAVQRFVFASRQQVRRSDTAIFRQVSPELVLLLIGETAADGSLTAERPLIRAAYPPEQELARDGQRLNTSEVPLAASMTATPSPTPDAPLAHLYVEIVAVTTQGDTQGDRLTTKFRVYNGGDRPLDLTPDDLTLTLGYAPLPPGPRQPAETLPPLTLFPGQAADVTLIWPWHGEKYGVLRVGAWQWHLTLG
jgi:hypothetical protein